MKVWVVWEIYDKPVRLLGGQSTGGILGIYATRRAAVAARKRASSMSPTRYLLQAFEGEVLP